MVIYDKRIIVIFLEVIGLWVKEITNTISLTLNFVRIGNWNTKFLELIWQWKNARSKLNSKVYDVFESWYCGSGLKKICWKDKFYLRNVVIVKKLIICRVFIFRIYCGILERNKREWRSVWFKDIHHIMNLNNVWAKYKNVFHSFILFVLRVYFVKSKVETGL